MDIGLIQQGDVLFHRIDKLPKSVVLKTSENGTVIFAYGEATGHHHGAAVEISDTGPNFSLYEKDEVLYMEIFRTTQVVHQEHKPVILTPGIYRRGLVREIDPFAQEVRSVRD